MPSRNVISQFIDLWSRESKATVAVLECIPDGALAFQHPGFGRTLGDLSWHIVTALKEIGDRAGLVVDGPGRKTPRPHSVRHIVETYARAAETIHAGLGKLEDDDLSQLVQVYDQKWTRAKTFQVLIGHEIHHRGQLTVLARMAGLSLPETYGPTGQNPA